MGVYHRLTEQKQMIYRNNRLIDGMYIISRQISISKGQLTLKGYPTFFTSVYFNR